MFVSVVLSRRFNYETNIVPKMLGGVKIKSDPAISVTIWPSRVTELTIVVCGVDFPGYAQSSSMPAAAQVLT